MLLPLEGIDVFAVVYAVYPRILVWMVAAILVS